MLNASSVPRNTYNPTNLLDFLRRTLELHNDAALARMLDVTPTMLSRVRRRRTPVGASLLIRMHEVTGVSVSELGDVMGDRRSKYRLSEAQGRPKQEEQFGA